MKYMRRVISHLMIKHRQACHMFDTVQQVKQSA